MGRYGRCLQDLVKRAFVRRGFCRGDDDTSLTCGVGVGSGGGGGDICRWFRAITPDRSEGDELHQLVITSQDADAERVRGEHDNQRHVEGHYRAVQHELSTTPHATTPPSYHRLTHAAHAPTVSRTAARSCRDPETRISFLVARWRPTQAAACRVCRRLLRPTAAAAADVCRQGGSLELIITN